MPHTRRDFFGKGFLKRDFWITKIHFLRDFFYIKSKVTHNKQEIKLLTTIENAYEKVMYLRSLSLNGDTL
jgi:hypothetical protein